jgi:uncharacterized protein YqgC (DUF456 family)
VSAGGIVLVALAIAVGIVGIFLPVLPGTLLVFGAIGVWAVVENNVTGWVTLGVVTLLLGAATVIPVLGLVIGFVLGVYLAELANRRDQRVAWTSTKHAVKGVALSVGVELAGALLATVAWVAGVYLTQ